ncbi:MAG TPA: helix-turn-helix domain-containing protein [Acidimicrobiales bacterium]|nr:helix-turn-helix domain-containing protein [Acidimicrobiales bacterium]
MAYRERASVMAGAVLWQREPSRSTSSIRILPDGCMDLIWDGARLFVAGPDTRARWHMSRPGSSYIGLRFSGGLGPHLLRVPADAVRDQSPALNEIWSGADERALREQVQEDPVGAMERWLAVRAADVEPPQLGTALFCMAAAGTPVSAMAETAGYSTRQLDRRCSALFGYGPQHLTRVLRLGRTLADARRGTSLAHAAATNGFADQAHLSREVRDLAGTTLTVLLTESAG